MSPLLRLCNTCGHTYPLTDRSTGKCPDCARAYEREKSQRRRTTSTATRTRDSQDWQTRRAQARARDGGCTQHHTGGCHGNLAVHHIIPLEQGGTNALDNLATLCRAHHEQAERLFGVPHPTRQIGVRERNDSERQEGPSIG